MSLKEAVISLLLIGFMVGVFISWIAWIYMLFHMPQFSISEVTIEGVMCVIVLVIWFAINVLYSITWLLFIVGLAEN